MKKLAFFFIVLISLVVVAGCNRSEKNVTRFSSDKKTESGATVVRFGQNTNPTTPINLIEKTSETSDVSASAPEPIVKFAITSHAQKTVETTKGYQLISGTTPPDTAKILVNDYELNKYKPGITTWSYVAATSLGNLKAGENRFTIKALDKKGDLIASDNLNILYKGADTGALVNTGGNLNVVFLLTAGIMGLFVFVRKRIFN